MYWTENRLGMGPASAGISSGFVVVGPNPTESEKEAFKTVNYEVNQSAAQMVSKQAQEIAAAASARAVAAARRGGAFVSKNPVIVPLTIAAIVAGVVIAKKKKKRRGR